MEQALSNKRPYLAVLTAIVLAVSLPTAAPPVLAAHGNDNHWKASITPTSVAADTEVEFVLKFENDEDSTERIAELEVSVPAGFVPVLGSFVAVPNQPTSGFTPPCQGNHAWNVDFNAAPGVIKVNPPAEPAKSYDPPPLARAGPHPPPLGAYARRPRRNRARVRLPRALSPGCLS
jgi:hypothetical protein